ncbi:MAG: HD domain-containing phosphohydrolase [Actinomycetota bacterium]
MGLVLAVFVAGTRRWPVGFSVGRANFDADGILVLTALIVGGPVCGLLVAAPSALYRDPARTAFQGAALTLQVLGAAWAFALLYPEPLLFEPGFSSALIWGTLAAGLVFFGLDSMIGPALMRLKYRLSWREIVAEIVLPPLPSDALTVVATLATALAVATWRPLAALTLLGGAALSLTVFSRVREGQRRALRLESENAALREALRTSNLALATRMVGALGQRDGYTAAQAAASAVYAADIAREMCLGEERAREVRLAALLADVGLLYVPDGVLLSRPERLNPLGRARLEEHPVSGERILASVPGLEEAARWVRWHHERADGAGYPDRLPGAWIPLEARILAVASFYASLIVDRPEAPGMSAQEARRALISESGKAVDPTVVRALVRVLDSRDSAYAAATGARFSFPSQEFTEEEERVSVGERPVLRSVGPGAS